MKKVILSVAMLAITASTIFVACKKDEVKKSDMCGAIGGSLKGGLKGMGFGPGGATAGVLIGFVGGAALSSAAAYGHSKIQGWLGL